ncbi:biotin transporter BioY [Corynebacterium hindlerae]|uniref:Biotin transporter n=1 Tax=Corynebacterium hindlerae TaxID=699041 RepID=A0A7G5FFU9_9CORY|nr:biotin transporter BioY [Corynebacterium hindlerae]QMV85490.1 biotin transporter BioY [Corynebacterium hindlerae]
MSATSAHNPMRDVAYVAVFAALIIVFAFFTIPGAAGVPIVLQNAIVILTGLVLGPKRGTAAAVLFLLLGLLGFPVLAGGRSLLSALAGPTVGYIVGYVISAFVAGAIAYQAKSASSRYLLLIVGAFAGLAVQYACGVVGLMLVASMDLVGALGVQVPFLIPDAVKVAIMVAIASGVHAAFPDLMQRK